MNSITRYAAIYGGCSGAVIIATIIGGTALADRISFAGSEFFGYLVMLVALIFIFVGIKRYRDIERGGIIRFLPAFGVGLAIALVAAFVYVLVWEVYLAATNYAFINDYIDGIRHAKQAAGVTGAALDRAMAPLEAMRTSYANPLFRLPMTFMEIAPVGAVVSLVSAALLRNPRILPAR